MGRYLDSSCKQCRREGMKLMLKGARCETAKCPVEKKQRNLTPGMHSWRRGRISEYGVRLREKQKVKRYYGLLERQFMRYFHKAERMKGNTGETLLQLLERRLDNTIYQLGFASSRKQARQFVGHGFVYINDRRVNIPSFIVKVNDEISLKFKGKGQKNIKEVIKENENRTIPAWLSSDPDHFKGKILRLPEREDITFPVNEQLIVELYSR